MCEHSQIEPQHKVGRNVRCELENLIYSITALSGCDSLSLHTGIT